MSQALGVSGRRAPWRVTPRDIAFGQNTDRHTGFIDNDQRADAVSLHSGDGLRDCFSGIGGRDLRPLGCQNCFNEHCLPLLIDRGWAVDRVNKWCAQALKLQMSYKHVNYAGPSSTQFL
jgi:hypothetical protein